MSTQVKYSFKVPVWLWPGLTFLFVILKLAGAITWSWVWVFAPLWIPYGFMLAMYIFLIIVSAIIALLDPK